MSHFLAEFYSANIEILKQRYLREHGEPEAAHQEHQDTISNKAEEAMPASEKEVTPMEEETAPSNAIDRESPAIELIPASKERTEGAIVFEQADFERLKEVPKY